MILFVRFAHTGQLAQEQSTVASTWTPLACSLPLNMSITMSPSFRAPAGYVAHDDTQGQLVADGGG